MVFFITYLWKADRLLEGEGVLSESEFAGRLLAVVCENGVLYRVSHNIVYTFVS